MAHTALSDCKSTPDTFPDLVSLAETHYERTQDLLGVGLDITENSTCDMHTCNELFMLVGQTTHALADLQHITHPSASAPVFIMEEDFPLLPAHP